MVDSPMQKIVPFLWFDRQAEEAMHFYTSIFPRSRAGKVTRYGDGGPFPKGTAMTVSFELEGQEFHALNGGPEHPFTPAISLLVSCETQAEVDQLWAKLSDGGKPGPCGWLEDRYGVSWQIIPTALPRLLGDADPERAARAVQAMLGMQKIDIAALERAAAGA
jgi:predicted 3-demethylubiquinone-9 3-methyltransferase (glyoxalase superfamily)